MRDALLEKFKGKKNTLGKQNNLASWIGLIWTHLNRVVADWFTGINILQTAGYVDVFGCFYWSTLDSTTAILVDGVLPDGLLCSLDQRDAA